MSQTEPCRACIISKWNGLTWSGLERPQPPSLWRQGKRPWPFGAGERGGGAPLALWRLGKGSTPGPLALGKGVQPYLQPFKFLKERNMQPFNF